MRLDILFLGKTKEPILVAGIADYEKRLSRYLKVHIKTVREPKIKKGEPESLLIEKESEALLQNVQQGAHLVCLDRTGVQMDSLELAAELGRWQMQGMKTVTLVIGGHLGLSTAILKRANLLLSLSRMTFTHEMTRLLLLEQLYRACTIQAGEKYHK